MRIRQERADNDQMLTVKVLRALRHLREEYDYALPNNWSAIVEIAHNIGEVKRTQKKNYELVSEGMTDFFALDVESKYPGTNCALAKMYMLQKFPKMLMTGVREPLALSDQIKECSYKYPEDIQESLADVRDEIIRLEDLRQMQQETIRLLLSYNITAYAGGIRVPYSEFAPTSYGFRERSGEIRIAFSGAKEHEDVFFAFYLLRDVRKALDEMDPFTQITLCLDKLKKDSSARMAIELLGIKAV